MKIHVSCIVHSNLFHCVDCFVDFATSLVGICVDSSIRWGKVIYIFFFPTPLYILTQDSIMDYIAS